MGRRLKRSLEYILKCDIEFPDETVAKTVYKSIYNDVVRDKLDQVEIKLDLSRSKLGFEIRSRSLAKFLGFTNTTLRLISLVCDLIEKIKSIEQ